MTNNDENIEVYDFVTADSLENGDHITFKNEQDGEEYLEHITVIDSGDSIMVKGLSIISGDTTHYIFPFGKEVGLWSV